MLLDSHNTDRSLLLNVNWPVSSCIPNGNCKFCFAHFLSKHEVICIVKSQNENEETGSVQISVVPNLKMYEFFTYLGI